MKSCFESGNTIIKNKKIRDQISEYNQLIEKINCEKYIFSIGADSGNLHYRNFSESEKKLYTEFFQNLSIVICVENIHTTC